MAKLVNFFRTAAMVSLTLTAISLPVAGGSASAAPVAPPAPQAVVKAPLLSPAAKMQMRRDRTTVCVNAHVQNVGWQGWRCSTNRKPAIAGTVGRSLRLEALAISTMRPGGVCAQAHVQDQGWQRSKCTGRAGNVAIGTQGRSLRMEALRLSTRTPLCAQAHVATVGWQKLECSRRAGQIQVGTVGRSLSIEALRVLA
ncbi:hypothetical protein [Paractinoplanes lichenicola]|uniref:Hydrophobic W protein n=1 Tax=Paractinoplanes lichenicola TaxID=2802976 RepID=A0ABS1VIF5_9ACTN|nr:hypothetical protein [Actinoplanes lichenicola]MBL7253512.1 hypothetical protein [Actinoplanes lichenicola]